MSNSSIVQPLRALALAALVTACSDGTAGPNPGSSLRTPERERAIASGLRFTCMLTDTGTAYCWGANTVGQLGTGDTVSSMTPRAVGGGRRFVEISLGDNFACALDQGSAAYCWGTGLQGQLGNGTFASATAPVAVAGGKRFQAIGVGYQFACGLEASTNDVWCWGDNTSGSLGTGDTTSHAAPVQVIGGVKFKNVSVGLLHSCGMSNDAANTVYCWGWNFRHQMSTALPATTLNALSPVVIPVSGGSSSTTVAAGGVFSCIFDASTRPACWGETFYGEIGIGFPTRGTFITPRAMITDVTFRGLALGVSNDLLDASCGWTPSGAAYCWGANSMGQLGSTKAASTCEVINLPTFGCTGAPLPVDGLTSFVALSSGGEHVCGIATDHSVLCWGRNRNGELGNGTTTNASAPTPISGGLRAP